MRIVHVAAEMAPIAKVGGMGDVVLGLTKKLKEKHQEVSVILPYYHSLIKKDLRNVRKSADLLLSYEKGISHANSIWNAESEGIPITFIEDHHPASYFGRENIYGYEDDVFRFLYFCRTALEYLLHTNMEIDILHLHDWHAAPMAFLHRELFLPKGLKIKSIVLTLHNVEHQGKCAPWDLAHIGMENPALLTQMQEGPQTINLLKGGIVAANAITTVSPTYSKEILHKDYGFGLETILLEYSDKLLGVLNGIDAESWNPATDPLVPYHYSNEETLKKIKKNKDLSKKALQKKLRLKEEDKPIVSVITRLVPQKGVELIPEALFHTLEKQGQFILLGSTPIPAIRETFLSLQRKLTGMDQAALCLHHDEELSHLIYAGSDFVLLPSRFEPCGLVQLIGLRYGTIPIVRKVGGLADTVFDRDDPFLSEEKKNGFVFEEFDSDALKKTLDRALHFWFANQKAFQNQRKQNMELDVSWETPGNQYLELYQRLLNP